MENIQKLLCEMQYKGKLTKRSHHSKPLNCSNHSKTFRCSFGDENLVGSENSASFIMPKLCTALKCQLSANLNVFRLPNEQEEPSFSSVHINDFRIKANSLFSLGSSTIFFQQ